MTDALLSLASSVHNSKGVYALLLGSGISRSSGVPTGWEVTQDLIRRMAVLEGVETIPHERWFADKYGTEAGYSDILARLAGTPSERIKLLQGYFEATEEERSEGRKVPTKAHRAIAQLVAKGYIRVIVTTNFDRLLEQALADVGVQSSVVTSADSLGGILPIVHSSCTVIKINGDYLDPRFRNTLEELSSYEPEIETLLDRVFDEYGLIICGWSADWDVALRSAMERCPNRRFTTYWASKGNLSELATRVASNRHAKVIPIEDADSFFVQIVDSVEALESFSASDPLSAQVAVARTKRYLSGPEFAIALHDLLVSQTTEVIRQTSLKHFPTDNENVSPEALQRRLRQYDAICDVLVQTLVCATFFGTTETDSLVLRAFRRIVDSTGAPLGMTMWISFRRYPALLLLYGLGIAAISKGKYPFLKQLLSVPILDPQSSEYVPVGRRLHDFFVIERQHQSSLLNDAVLTPLSDHLFARLKEPLKDYLPTESEYETFFTWYEYLYGILYLDAALTAKEVQDLVSNNDMKSASKSWVPPNRFVWTRMSLDRIGDEEFPKALHAGIIGSSGEDVKTKLEGLRGLLENFVGRMKLHWHLF